MDGTIEVMRDALSNPRVVENAIGVAEMVANLSQIADREIAIDAVAEHLGVSRNVVLVALGIAREALTA